MTRKEKSFLISFSFMFLFILVGISVGLFLLKNRQDIRQKAAICPVYILPETKVWSAGEKDQITLVSGGPITYRWVGEIPTDSYRQFGSGEGTLKNGESITITHPVPQDWGPADKNGAREVHVTAHLSGDCGYKGHGWDRWFHGTVTQTQTPSPTPQITPSLTPSPSPTSRATTKPTVAPITQTVTTTRQTTSPPTLTTQTAATPTPTPSPTPELLALLSATPTPDPTTAPTSEPTTNPTPAPTTNPSCNSDCVTNDDCPTNLVCHAGSCRNPSCSDSETCSCPVTSLTSPALLAAAEGPVPTEEPLPIAGNTIPTLSVAIFGAILLLLGFTILVR